MRACVHNFVERLQTTEDTRSTKRKTYWSPQFQKCPTPLIVIEVL